MNFSLHAGEQWLWDSKPVGVEEVTLKLIIKRFFVFSRGPFRAWLIFDRTTGRGRALAVGSFQPKPKARRKMKHMHLLIDVAEVDPKFQPVLIEFGPAALRWNGTSLKACGQ